MSDYTPLSVDDWLRAVPGLRRHGQQWKGVCPACQATKDFWIREGTRRPGAVVGCGRGCDYESLLRGAGLWRDAGDAKAIKSTPATPPPAPPISKPTYSAPMDMWRAGLCADDTPGKVYLTYQRAVWVPSVALPRSVRWLPAETARGALEGVHMPPWAAGSLMYAYQAERGAICAVSMLAVTDDGLDLPKTAPGADGYFSGRVCDVPARWRRTFGSAKGAACALGAPGGAPVVVVEGEVTGLAAVWLSAPGSQVLAAGGASGVKNLAPLLIRGERAVDIWVDFDTAGREAAMDLQRKCAAAGLPCTMNFKQVTAAPGSDAADYLHDAAMDTGCDVDSAVLTVHRTLHPSQ